MFPRFQIVNPMFPPMTAKTGKIMRKIIDNVIDNTLIDPPEYPLRIYAPLKLNKTGQLYAQNFFGSLKPSLLSKEGLTVSAKNVNYPKLGSKCFNFYCSRIVFPFKRYCCKACSMSKGIKHTSGCDSRHLRNMPSTPSGTPPVQQQSTKQIACIGPRCNRPPESGIQYCCTSCYKTGGFFHTPQCDENIKSKNKPSYAVMPYIMF